MITEFRKNHILGVARKLQQLSEQFFPNNEEKAREMFLIGWLHDFGYEFVDKNTVVDHPFRGAEILNRTGFKYTQVIAQHGDPEIKEMSDELFLLNCADMMTGPNGEQMTLAERVENMITRFGENSEAHLKAIKMKNLLEQDPRYNKIK
ncbi:MAG: HD domain-containing protein [Alphaproteobacteria bacterium]|nr:HD domain-containing protein [Alphaproteobacteria bacterium]